MVISDDIKNKIFVEIGFLQLEIKVLVKMQSHHSEC